MVLFRFLAAEWHAEGNLSHGLQMLGWGVQVSVGCSAFDWTEACAWAPLGSWPACLQRQFQEYEEKRKPQVQCNHLACEAPEAPSTLVSPSQRKDAQFRSSGTVHRCSVSARAPNLGYFSISGLVGGLSCNLMPDRPERNDAFAAMHFSRPVQGVPCCDSRNGACSVGPKRQNRCVISTA